MRAILDIAINDLRIMFKDRSIWINLIVVPLVLSYVIGLANSSGGGVPTAANLLIDVVNLDSGAVSQQFLSDLKAVNPNFVLCPMDNDEKDICQLNGGSLDAYVADGESKEQFAQENPTTVILTLADQPYNEPLTETRLKDQTSLALIIIPGSFSSNINAGKNVSITYRSNESAVAPSYILQSVQAEVQRLGGAATAAKIGTDAVANFPPLTFKDDADKAAFTDAIRQKASTIWTQNPAQVEYTVATSAQSTDAQSSSSAGFSQSMPGIGTMYAMFIVFPAAAAIILERKTWTLQRLAVMPLSRAQILGGKLLARFATGMLEYGLMFSFGFLLGARYGSDPLAIVLLMIAFVLAVTALTLALTTILRNEGQARGITLFLTLTLAPLGGAWWPLDIVPEFMRTIGHLSPVAWVMDGFRSVIFFGGNLGTVIPSLLVLFGMALVFFVIGVRRFKFTD